MASLNKETESKASENISVADRIYLDYQASTPCDQAVVNHMLPYLTEKFGNPHARTHSFGWEAEEALEQARKQIATCIGATENEIIFTSGATESNNLALKGLAKFWHNSKKHIITSEIEHKCVLEALRELEREGYEITFLHVNEEGFIDLSELEKAIRSDTLCVTISAVNHEIGTIQQMEAIGKITKKHNIFLHVDAAQALGKITIDVNKWNVDLMSLSAHKVYGPKGIGALYLRCKPTRVRVKPLNSGGGQERGMRSGTTPVFLAVGMGQACELFANPTYLAEENKRIFHLHKTFLKSIMELEHIYLNGPNILNHTLDEALTKRIPHNINISIAGVEGEGLMMQLPNCAFSSGSACTSANLEPSYVLRAIGMKDAKEDLLHSSIRISFGKDTTEEEVIFVAEEMKKAINLLREISPVWEELMTTGKSYN